MRDTLVRIISIFLAIISVIIFIVFLQNVFYNGNPFTIGNHRVLITDKDYEDEQIKKDEEKKYKNMTLEELYDNDVSEMKTIEEAILKSIKVEKSN